MLVLGEAYSPYWQGWPEAMATEDYRLWAKYRPIIADRVRCFYFNVGLSGQELKDIEVTEELRWQWLRATQKRIDVLADAYSEWWIIELRSQAKAEAIGRLLMYDTLFEEEKPDRRKTKLILVTDRYDKDVEKTAKRFNIEYIIIT